MTEARVLGRSDPKYIISPCFIRRPAYPPIAESTAKVSVQRLVRPTRVAVAAREAELERGIL